MKLSFVILNYNTYEMTLKLVANLEDIRMPFETEIIVVDNASPNESGEVLKKESNFNKRFVFIQNDKNNGYASGNNVGIKYAIESGADYILVTNNDIEIDSADNIKAMIDLIEQKANIGAVSPKIVSKDGKKDPPLYPNKPSFFDMTLGIVKCHKERYKFDESCNSRIYAPRGSFMLLSSNAMKEIDYLDEGTFLYYEEPILAERLARKDYECWYCANAEIIHNHGKTISTTIKKKKTCRILCNSLDHYLAEYRNYNVIKRKICVWVRYCSYMIRR